MLGALAEYYFHAFTPALVNTYKLPCDLGRDIAQQNIRCRMNVQGGSDQVEQRLFGRQLADGEISKAGKFSATVVPLDSRPVIQALQREVDILVGLQLHNREPAVMRGGQHVEHSAVGGGECGNLRIERARVQSLIDHADIADHQRLQPAFGTQAKEKILAGAVGMAGIAKRGNELQEERPV